MNLKALESDLTKAHQTSNSRRKTRAVLRFPEWSIPTESVTKLSRPFSKSTESTVQTFASSVMLLKMISSISLKETESTFHVCML